MSPKRQPLVNLRLLNGMAWPMPNPAKQPVVTYLVATAGPTGQETLMLTIDPERDLYLDLDKVIPTRAGEKVGAKKGGDCH